jgi:hypothetical protein
MVGAGPPGPVNFERLDGRSAPEKSDRVARDKE